LKVKLVKEPPEIMEIMEKTRGRKEHVVAKEIEK